MVYLRDFGVDFRVDVRKKLEVLADAAKYDASCASSGSRRERPADGLGNTTGMGICHSYTPDGRCVSLLKILLTNYCIYDCAYCINRISSDVPRARFTPEEVVFLTVEFYRRNYIEGLFLSSGVIQSPDYTMEQMVRTVRSLREDHRFYGYIHVKAVPGASEEMLALAGQYADRISANIELAVETDLQRLAPAKSHGLVQIAMKQIQSRTAEAKELRQRFAPAGQSTQLIVGAAAEHDAAVLAKASQLYEDYGLRRVYYSGFSPIPDADPSLPARRAPLVREHRLYQADWLIRFYGFTAGELTTPAVPDLSLRRDPKLEWALRNREFFPVDVNHASRAALLRVPGIGVRNVTRILKIRRHRALRLDDLAKLRVALDRARCFILTADHNPSVLQLDAARLPVPEQLPLFAATVQGEL